jgi:hypothetical protein
MLTSQFYKYFIDYDYILIYQLDAFVFSDELHHWCNQGYDYIGSPWYLDFDGSDRSIGLHAVGGNGGFSLRKVRSFIKTLSTFTVINKPQVIIRQYSHLGILGRTLRIPFIIGKTFGLRNNSFYLRKTFSSNEDKFYAFFASKINPDFKVAPVEESIKFSFECQPQRLYSLNGNKLPFGCHAWQKHNIDFWKPFIECFGYDLSFL